MKLGVNQTKNQVNLTLTKSTSKPNMMIETIKVPHLGLLSLFTLFLKKDKSPINPQTPSTLTMMMKVVCDQPRETQFEKSSQILQIIDIISTP